MDSARSFAPTWYFRLAQGLVAIIILAITGSAASDWHKIHCSTPGRLGYNISAAALTLPLVLYFILSSGPMASLHKLPWSRWVQLGLDALFFILWLAASGVSNYTCDGLCSSCTEAGRLDNYDGYFYVTVGSSYCECYLSESDSDSQNNKRDLFRRAGGFRSGGEDSGITKLGLKASKQGAKKGFDALMVVLFFITLATTVFMIYKTRRGDHAAPAAHRADNNPPADHHPETGIPMTNP